MTSQTGKKLVLGSNENTHTFALFSKAKEPDHILL